jgi:peroxiredoxin
MGLALLALAIASPARGAYTPTEGASLVGTRAPEWRGLTWLQGGPLTMQKLRGKPVLVRFWTDGCEFCRASAGPLRELDEKYRARGLVVVGIHHPKAPESHDPKVIAKAAKELGFAFPIATDPEWTTVKAYGVGTTFKNFTSVSFLIDQTGVIRWVHDGGTIDEPARASLETAIEGLLH